MNLTASGQTVFIADLHHKGGREEEIDRLLNEIPSNTRRIFFLGDTFHYWVNESSFIQEKYASFLELLQKWSRDGIHLFFLEGNRDFLAARFFDEQPWIDVLPNPSLIEMGGRIVYIGHGDELCWNDWAYQFYKTMIRARFMRFLADRLPASWRIRAAEQMAQASEKIVAAKDEITLQIPPRAYEQIISEGVNVIIHGHLHTSYQREYMAGDRSGVVYCFGWKNGKRNLIHFAG